MTGVRVAPPAQQRHKGVTTPEGIQFKEERPLRQRIAATPLEGRFRWMAGSLVLVCADVNRGDYSSRGQVRHLDETFALLDFQIRHERGIIPFAQLRLDRLPFVQKRSNIRSR